VGDVTGDEHLWDDPVATVPGSVGPSPPQAFTMARLGNLRWAELQVFSIAGGWVGTSDDPAVAVTLSAVSAHAAWRARNLADRLPTIGEFRAASVTVPTSDAMAGFPGELVNLDGDLRRVAVLAEVLLPSLVAALNGLVEVLSPVADAPSLRIIPICVADLEADVGRLTDVIATAGAELDQFDVFLAGTRTSLESAGGW
jgi:hypothetical protein